MLFKSASVDWRTPAAIYAGLNGEYAFTFDPCPLRCANKVGLLRPWTGERVFCNPPYNRAIGKWLAKAREADLAVFLVPARTDTAWWHEFALQADEIRFIRGRLRFGGAAKDAPFPSVVLIYRGSTARLDSRDATRLQGPA